MKECGILHETDPSLPSFRLKVNFYDDCESFPVLESNFVGDASSTDQEDVFDPPLISLLFVVPSFSSTPLDIIISDLTLLAFPIPLAQCIGLEMDEFSKTDASVIEDDFLAWSKELTLVEPSLEQIPFEELCGDDVMASAIPTIGLIGSICILPLNFDHFIPFISHHPLSFTSIS